FAIPTYLFLVTIIGMALLGLIKLFTGTLGTADSAQYDLAPETGYDQLAGFAMFFLLLRAFSSGCAALTGVEAISNG
ncbi:DNA-binding protein, partial [Burkholderia multivorans]